MSGKKGWTFRFPSVHPLMPWREGGCLVLWGQGGRPDTPLWLGRRGPGCVHPVGRARYRWRVVKVPAPQSACLDTAQQAGELEVEAS